MRQFLRSHSSVVRWSPQPSRRMSKAQTEAPLLGIMQAELQRNLTALKTTPDPAYFVGYTVHDTRSTRLAASVGALLRSDQAQSRAASVEVRVGDYTFDNTHPLRGDGNVGPRITRVNLPLTDIEAPIRLELWRGTDRAYRQAAEALTRARTNAAAKIQDDEPAPDFSREEPQVHAEPPTTYTVDTPRGRSGCAGCRRRSARIR